MNVFRDESITELLEETIRDYFLDLPAPTEEPPGKQTIFNVNSIKLNFVHYFCINQL